MSYESVTKEEADALYEMEKRIVDPKIVWELTSPHRYKIAINIETEDKTPLIIKGTLSYNPEHYYSFALLYQNTIPIRRWDTKKGHIDPLSTQTTMGAHKHFWHPDYQTSCCYEVDDIRLNDVNGALMDFFKECNVIGRIPYEAVINDEYEM